MSAVSDLQILYMISALAVCQCISPICWHIIVILHSDSMRRVDSDKERTFLIIMSNQMIIHCIQLLLAVCMYVCLSTVRCVALVLQCILTRSNCVVYNGEAWISSVHLTTLMIKLDLSLVILNGIRILYLTN